MCLCLVRTSLTVYTLIFLLWVLYFSHSAYLLLYSSKHMPCISYDSLCVCAREWMCMGSYKPRMPHVSFRHMIVDVFNIFHPQTYTDGVYLLISEQKKKSHINKNVFFQSSTMSVAAETIELRPIFTNHSETPLSEWKWKCWLLFWKKKKK